ncbi:MAG TPA: hypothetical protein VFZ66_21400 [Herpetosiphonaceae bacterium]
MEKMHNPAPKQIRLSRDDLAFNQQGELVIKNAELIEAIKAQLAASDAAEIQGYAMTGDTLPTYEAISISIVKD